ncbi:ubiquitin-protein ligase [Ceraceosorus bombacis]|uniref:HECT-type E3 ubiquitin transferase n=1 Tax=Ceraceosorus bombacis TaxID=401625 RepID=A0A0P1BBT6_9BASI|nr:ubiquitin-protein ligase [Ceraceosorus bombacis]
MDDTRSTRSRRTAPSNPSDTSHSSTAAPNSASQALVENATPSRQTRRVAGGFDSAIKNLDAAPSSSKAKGKRRRISPDPPQPSICATASAKPGTSGHTDEVGGEEQGSQGTSYNLRPRRSGDVSGSIVRTVMAPKRHSGAGPSSSISPTGALPGSSTAANANAKGKAKARASRSTRSAARNAVDPVDECSDMRLDTAANDAGDANAEDADMMDLSAALAGDDELEALDPSLHNQDEDDEDDEDEGDGEKDDDEEERRAREAEEAMVEDDDDEGPYEDEMDDPYGDGEGGAYGSTLRAMASFMSGLPSRFRALLAGIKDSSDPSAQLVALQELSEVLSMSTEDQLQGYFPTESFVRELVHLMGGPKPDSGTKSKSTSSAAVASSVDDDLAAVAAATGEGNDEAMLIACRCLANLIEAMPYAAHSVVGCGALPVLHSKLKEIQFIDLAEQVLLTLEKISAEYPSGIVREGGLLAMLQYIDFFGMHVQRTAMQAAANCCRKLMPESFPMVRDVLPIIQSVLTYPDQRLVESACKCVVRIIDSYRHRPDLLEQVLTNEMVAALNAILLAGGGSGGSGSATSSTGAASTAVSTATYTDILKTLGLSAHSSPEVAVILLDKNIVETLYLLLTGSPAPAEDGSGGRGPAASLAQPLQSEGVTDSAESAPMAVLATDVEPGAESVAEGTAVADVAVLQNLAHRPKEQIQEALSLVCELMPPLPRDGIFDARAYGEKAYARRKKSQAKAARDLRHASRAAKGDGSSANVSETSVKQEPDTDIPPPVAPASDAPAAASFSAAILSSRDNPALVLSALQLVDLLNTKLPRVYSAALRREGVVWEIEDIASREPARSTLTKTSPKEKGTSVDKVESAPAPSVVATTPGSAASDSAKEAYRARLVAAGHSQESASAAIAALGLGANSLSALGLPTKAPVLPTDADDANIWRARMMRDRFAEEVSASSAADGSEAIRALDHLKALVQSLQGDATEVVSKAEDTLKAIASQLSRKDSPISSFELLRSGLVNGLYNFSVGSSEAVPTLKRRELLVTALMKRTDSTLPSPASSLVRRLQETLSRLEKFDITSALSGSADDTRRSPTANVARLVRLKLVAEGETKDIPRSCNNIVVSIHAIAAFRNLNEYLRPKIAAAMSSGGSGAQSAASRLSGMLAAMAAGSGADFGSDLGFLAGSSRTKASGSSGEAATASGGASSSKAEDARAEGGEEAAKPRRSSRLSAKSAGESAGDGTEGAGASGSGGDHETSAHAALGEGIFGGDEEDASQLARRMLEGIMNGDMEGDDGYSDDDGYEEDVIEDSAAAAALDSEAALASGEDKTVNLKVPASGENSQTTSGLQTPADQGAESSTQANKPLGASPPKRAGQSAVAESEGSYASAVQKKPTDWHLEFKFDGKDVSLASTIYQAVHNFEMTPARQASGLGRYIWNNVYTVRYKKVEGPQPATDDAVQGTPEPVEAETNEVQLPSSVPAEAPFAKILQLLSVLHDLNSEWRESTGDSQRPGESSAATLDEVAFVNNKLTAKLNRQLEEPMIVASSCLPGWATELPRAFPFLYPFEARYSYLQNTAFGYHRLISRWQVQQSRNQDSSSATSRNDDSLALLGRLSRQKVRIQRSNIFPSAMKVLELYGTTSALLEVEYFEEVGTGLGPTLEFYALVSREFAKKSVLMWRDDGGGPEDSEYVSSPLGLFPTVLSAKDAKAACSSPNASTTASSPDKSDAVRLQQFTVLGQFVAKALLDSRIIDIHFSPVFMRLVLNQRLPETLGMLAAVDPSLARSMDKLRGLDEETLAGMGLDFTLPGHSEYELKAGGKEIAVERHNLEEYIQEVISHTLVHGVKPFVRAFRRGFTLIFPISAMASFTADELVMLFGNTEEDWGESTLLSAIKPDHGFNSESAAFRDIISIMASFGLNDRRRFLQWLTGSPKLPIGGLAGLHPQLTIVKRPHEAPLTPDDYLPSVMTCVNYLKLPSYSTKEVMRNRLETAMTEGGTSFHLS